jgi:cephalosporin hydroxylase
VPEVGTTSARDALPQTQTGLMGQSGGSVPRGLRPLLRRLKPRPRRYRRALRMRLEDWILYHQREIVFDRCTWMGVPMLKNPLDSWVLQEIVHETRPEVIVELGSAHGGSTLFLAQLLELRGGDGIVVSVDVTRETYVADHDRIVEVTGRTADADVLERVRELCDGRRVMAIHDASHRAEEVVHDLRLYSPLISSGCYLVVEDGIGSLLPRRKVGPAAAGPYEAIAQFLSEGVPFEPDIERERYLATYNPNGFLKRR